MGFFGTILGLFGFGVGISIGLVAGYFLFIYVQPNNVEVSVPFLSLFPPMSGSFTRELHLEKKRKWSIPYP